MQLRPTWIDHVLWCCTSGLYPASADEYEGLAAAIERLNLNDASVTVRKETSDALGAGFRCAKRAHSCMGAVAQLLIAQVAGQRGLPSFSPPPLLLRCSSLWGNLQKCRILSTRCVPCAATLCLCRCGFLGPLHLEVFLQRLQQEYAASVISTAPTVPYELEVQGGTDRIRLESIAEYPRNTKVGLGSFFG